MTRILILGLPNDAPHGVQTIVAKTKKAGSEYEEVSATPHSAIDNSDVVIAYTPGGFTDRSYMMRHILYALSAAKTVYILGPQVEDAKCTTCYWGRTVREEGFGCYFGFKLRGTIPLSIASSFCACEVEAAKGRMNLGKLGAAWTPRVGGDPEQERRDEGIW